MPATPEYLDLIEGLISRETTRRCSCIIFPRAVARERAVDERAVVSPKATEEPSSFPRERYLCVRLGATGTRDGYALERSQIGCDFRDKDDNGGRRGPRRGGPTTDMQILPGKCHYPKLRTDGRSYIRKT